ncbi:hypothetical protein [Mycobacterium sp. NAZ190054]|uniref:hypothetical protein n=1 Tax=Mycobacterium sp. NAZ190054 TaxID=1747766 RepID=UPI00079805FE|nr:hypothetical protein [Mycobacterium sp. NAZ190054]KWX56721.1 hypothetical protein ASJ79_02095 [Mycobacterium sp. NAZ190054]
MMPHHRIRVTRDARLPPLAWCVYARRGGDVELLCGVGVEVRDDGFFEGAWAGDAAAFDFVSRTDVFGSGGRIDGDELIIVPPSHTLERIQFLQRDDVTLISNSLVFMLVAAGAELDLHHRTYADDFTNVIHHGIRAFDTTIPVRFSCPAGGVRGGVAHLVYCHNVRFHQNGCVTFHEKPAGPPFETFTGYVDTLRRVLRQTIENAASPGRLRRYTPIASISSGYDSVAVAALARSPGCREAVTFSHARPNGGPLRVDDSGTVIGETLGYRVREFDREEYRKSRPFPEAEFLATGMSGEDVNMLALQRDIAHRVFLSGHYGGRVWDVHSAPDSHLCRKDMSGASLNEFRLRVDFIHIPAPFIGARRQPEIFTIGNSEEMKHWSVGTDYDRPVPRRIAEEEGVPRHSFGQTKLATAALLHADGESAWTSVTRDAVRRYARDLHLPLATRLGYLRDALKHSALSFASRVLHRFGRLHSVPRLSAKPVGIHSHTRLGPVPFIWAAGVIATRYQAAVRDWLSEIGGQELEPSDLPETAKEA